VAFKDGVYDITDFVKKHPGGSDKLMLGAGSNIETFWAFYPFHMKEHVLKLLESYRIGSLHPDDRVREEDVPKFDSNAQNLHSKNLKVLQNFPFIAETQSKTLVSSFVTPNSEFFIRAHQATPTVSNPSKYKVKLFNCMESAKNASSGQDEEEEPVLKLTIDDLKSKFTPHRVMTAMSCAGNRRLGMKEHSADVQGNMWYVGAIGNAQYTGVLLVDLLRGMGLKPEELQGKHLIAESLDVDVQGKPFKVSIPMEMVVDPLNEVLLAYEMNGVEIPKEHGYPLRLVVPGTVGVRNAKWVKRLYVSDDEANSIY